MMRHLREPRLPRERAGIVQKLTIPIKGMTSGACVNSVRNALLQISGVKDAQVKVGVARVTFDPALTNAAALRKAIVQAGFELATA
jgi:Cu+-exporting ATPase